MKKFWAMLLAFMLLTGGMVSRADDTEAEGIELIFADDVEIVVEETDAFIGEGDILPGEGDEESESILSPGLESEQGSTDLSGEEAVLANASDIAINAANFPDDSFRAYVSENCDTDKDGFLSDSEISATTKITAGVSGIKTLKGIEFFTELTYLVCDQNEISELDLSGNEKLYYLACEYNDELSTLDIRNCPRLINALFNGNCTLYEGVYFHGVSGEEDFISFYRKVETVPALPHTGVVFYGSNEPIKLPSGSQIKLSSGSDTGYFVACNSSDSSIVDVSNSGLVTAKAAGTAQITIMTNIDEKATVSITVEDGQSGIPISAATFPDAAFRTYVSENCDTDQDGSLSESETDAALDIYVNDMDIEDLTGIQYFTALEALSCDGNRLSSLDISKNGKLRYLYCSDNSIAAIDVSNNPRLVSALKKEGPYKNDGRLYIIPAKATDDTDPYLVIDDSITIRANGKKLYSPQMTLKRTVSPAMIGVGEKCDFVEAVTVDKTRPYYIRLLSQEACSFRSSDKGIVKVTSKGVIKGIKRGKATVTMSHNGIQVACTVQVKKAPEKVTLSKTKITLAEDGSKALKATIPSSSASRILTWSSTNEDVACFSDWTGRVEAVSPGTAIITVKTYNGKKASCKVTVRPYITHFSLPASELSLRVKQTCQIIPSIKPSADVSTVCSFSSGNKQVVSVNSEGKITAKKRGTAVITVKTWDGHRATCKVTVAASTTKPAIIPGKAVVNDTFQLTTTFPQTQKITWQSSAPEVATVSSKGLVTAKDYGEVTVTAKTKDGKTAKCTIVSSPRPRPTVDENSELESIRYLQEMLCELGYLSKSEITGIYKYTTREAVQAFQRDHDLNATGTADSDTLLALEYSVP